MANENLILSVNVSGDEKAKTKLRAFDRMLEQTRKRAAALNPMRVNMVAKLDDRITGPARRIQNLLATTDQKTTGITIAANYSEALREMFAVPASDLDEKIVHVLERIMVTVNNCDKQLAIIRNKLVEITGRALASAADAMHSVSPAATLKGNMLNVQRTENTKPASGSGEKLGLFTLGMLAASIIGLIGRKTTGTTGTIASAAAARGTRITSVGSVFKQVTKAATGGWNRLRTSAGSVVSGASEAIRTGWNRLTTSRVGQAVQTGWSRYSDKLDSRKIWNKVKQGTGNVKGSLTKSWEMIDKRYNIKQTYDKVAKTGIAPKFYNFAKVAEKWLKPVDFVMDAVELYNVSPDEKGKKWGKAIGKWGGLVLGTVFGGVPGGAVASFAGEKIGEILGGLVQEKFFNDNKNVKPEPMKPPTEELKYRYAFASDNGLITQPGLEGIKAPAASGIIDRPYNGLREEYDHQPRATGFRLAGFAAPLAAAGAVGGTVINLNFAGMIQSMTVNSADTQNVVQEVVEVVASSLQSIFENQGRC